jgi:hypothetical protein
LDRERTAKELAGRWFDEKEVQAEVAELLHRFQLTEAAIEAEAFKLQAEDLERIDRMLTLVMARRDEMLYMIAEIRGELGKLLRQASDRMLEHDEVPRLVARTRGG